MTRMISLLVDDELTELPVPPSDVEVIPGVRWGDPWVVFTPAYWLSQAHIAGIGATTPSHYRSENGVVGELVFCLLGGFGITAELAIAVYERCEQQGMINDRSCDQATWAASLAEPILINDRSVRYRFPNQKAKFLANAMGAITREPLRMDSGRALRDQLLALQGVGYKTASWIARNVLDSDEVAILDIHLIRAGQLCGVFSLNDRVERDYLAMETRFLDFSRAMGLRPAALDCLIWDQMRAAGDLPLRLLSQPPTTVSTQRKPGRTKAPQSLIGAIPSSP